MTVRWLDVDVDVDVVDTVDDVGGFFCGSLLEVAGMGVVVSDRGGDVAGDAVSSVQPVKDPAAITAMAIATRWIPVMPRRVAGLS